MKYDIKTMPFNAENGFSHNVLDVSPGMDMLIHRTQLFTDPNDFTYRQGIRITFFDKSSKKIGQVKFRHIRNCDDGSDFTEFHDKVSSSMEKIIQLAFIGKLKSDEFLFNCPRCFKLDKKSRIFPIATTRK